MNIWLAGFGFLVLLIGTVQLSAQPTPPRIPGLQVEYCEPHSVRITAILADCTRVLTSTKGSTKAKQVRTVTCVN